MAGLIAQGIVLLPDINWNLSMDTYSYLVSMECNDLIDPSSNSKGGLSKPPMKIERGKLFPIVLCGCSYLSMPLSQSQINNTMHNTDPD